jgi:hypothetical protein
MAITENKYTGNGSTVLYSFTFPYLEVTDIKVSLDGTLIQLHTPLPMPLRFNSIQPQLMGLLLGSIVRLMMKTFCYSSFLVLLFELLTLMTTSPRTCTSHRSLTETPHRQLQRLMLLQQRLTPLSATLVLL